MFDFGPELHYPNVQNEDNAAYLVELSWWLKWDNIITWSRGTDILPCFFWHDCRLVFHSRPTRSRFLLGPLSWTLSVLVSDRKSLHLHVFRSVCLHTDAPACSCVSLCMCFPLSSRMSLSSLSLFSFFRFCVHVYVWERKHPSVRVRLSLSLTLCCGSLCCVTVSHFTSLHTHVCVCVCVCVSSAVLSVTVSMFLCCSIHCFFFFHLLSLSFTLCLSSSICLFVSATLSCFCVCAYVGAMCSFVHLIVLIFMHALLVLFPTQPRYPVTFRQ